MSSSQLQRHTAVDWSQVGQKGRSINLRPSHSQCTVRNHQWRGKKDTISYKIIQLEVFQLHTHLLQPAVRMWIYSITAINICKNIFEHSLLVCLSSIPTGTSKQLQLNRPKKQLVDCYISLWQFCLLSCSSKIVWITGVCHWNVIKVVAGQKTCSCSWTGDLFYNQSFIMSEQHMHPVFGRNRQIKQANKNLTFFREKQKKMCFHSSGTLHALDWTSTTKQCEQFHFIWMWLTAWKSYWINGI